MVIEEKQRLINKQEEGNKVMREITRWSITRRSKEGKMQVKGEIVV